MSRVAAIQMNSLADPEQNFEQALQLLQQARDAGALLALVPEMFLSMNGKCYQDLAGDLGWIDRLGNAARDLGIWLVAGAVPQRDPDPAETRVRSASMVFDDQGELVARYDKIHLFDVSVGDAQGSYRESERFSPGDEVVVVDTPVGKLGLSICYDVRFPELYRKLREQGAELITVPAAFTWKTGQAHWDILLRARAVEQQCYVIAANQCGWHDDKRQTWGHSCIIDAWGRPLQSLGEEPGVVIADIDLAELHALRQRMPVLEHRRV
ncbi:carbon-nitrogen hydrolase family protein [Oceanobacter mangrovi]|uniref:carbon-nitrogen hydrolase family protein n=1 Tax=Oceanobacter mangrovi TaxID=2862510 RepID=UPI001C8E135A|nr:carbon-nitrogen hydrolase family protein [Oceanobacter mangrovi]